MTAREPFDYHRDMQAWVDVYKAMAPDDPRRPAVLRWIKLMDSPLPR